MSRILLGKIDIDVLVQLALLGPGDGEGWRPLTDDPDRTGELLWKRNYEAAADPKMDGAVPKYGFEPLPVTVTAVEGIKQCNFYLYQTADEEGRWRRGGAGRIVDDLKASLLSAMPEFRAAPWGWGARELEERSGRPRPVAPGKPEESEDPRIASWLAEWKSIGMPLTRMELTPQSRALVPDPRDLLASGYYRPPGHAGFAPVLVYLAAGDEAAGSCFIELLKTRQTKRWLDLHIYRFGSTVVETSFMPEHEAAFIPMIDRRVARLGSPGNHWWSLAPPVRQLDAKVLSSRVRLSAVRAGAHSDARAVYARTPKQREILMSLLEDAEVRDQVGAIDTRRKTVLLLRGVSEIGSVRSVTIEEELIDNGLGPALEHAMYIDTLGASTGIATLLVMDRLEKTPARATVRDPQVARAMIGDIPRRSDIAGS